MVKSNQHASYCNALLFSEKVLTTRAYLAIFNCKRVHILLQKQPN